MGTAVAHIIGRHVHHKARPDDTTPALVPPPTGIDYLRLVEAQHTTELAERVQYSQLPHGHVTGQPLVPDTSSAGPVPA
jgi:putative transposase